MATVEKISIALTQDMASLVRTAIESGEYATASEVIRDALRDWKQKRTHQEFEITELRRLWQEGLASGSAGPLDMEAIKREARQSLKTGR